MQEKEKIMKNSSAPVRSLVTVSFDDDGRELTYYNDRFDLEPGDRVFVSGKFAGKPAVIEEVFTKFKIRPSDYQRVIAVAGCPVRGTYEAVLNKMVCTGGDAMTPDEFRSWILPPRTEEEEEFIYGEGYDLDIFRFEEDEEASPALSGRAADYCSSGKVAYIGGRDGIGRAFIEGGSWYELEFRLSGDRVTEMYCDCPCPGLCKHLLAVAMTLGSLAENGLDLSRDFAAIDADRFWDMASAAKQVILP